MQEKLVDDSSKLVDQNDILLVDVAGGRGHNLFGFKCKFAEYPGRYVLMDLPHVMKGQTLHIASGEKQAFDFVKDSVVPGKLHAVNWALILTIDRCADLLYEIHLT